MFKSERLSDLFSVWSFSNHKAIEDMDKRLRDLRMRWVQEEEKKIDFGAGKCGG